MGSMRSRPIPAPRRLLYKRAEGGGKASSVVGTDEKVKQEACKAGEPYYPEGGCRNKKEGARLQYWLSQ
jgi:hypothetical protein